MKQPLSISIKASSDVPVVSAQVVFDKPIFTLMQTIPLVSIDIDSVSRERMPTRRFDFVDNPNRMRVRLSVIMYSGTQQQKEDAALFLSWLNHQTNDTQEAYMAYMRLPLKADCLMRFDDALEAEKNKALPSCYTEPIQ